MNKKIDRADSRGTANHGWLKSNFSFSFADYYNPEKMGFGALRVINDDWIAPGMGFGTHPHKDMEIVTIPLTGSLQHKDSTGHERVIKKGEVQIMSAGRGIAHSEFNASKTEPVSLLQTWVIPNSVGGNPGYDQREFPVSERKNKWQIVVSNKGIGMNIKQNAVYSLAELSSGNNLQYTWHDKQNGLYLFVIEGSINIAGESLAKRDAIALWNTDQMQIEASSDSELLAIEVPL